MSALEYRRNGFLNNVGIVKYKGIDALRYGQPTTLTAEENKKGFTDFVHYKLGYKEGEEEFLSPWGSWLLRFEPENKDPGDGEEEEEEKDPPKPSPTPAPSPYPTPAPSPPSPSPSPAPTPAPSPSPAPAPAPAPTPAPAPAPAPTPTPTPEPEPNPCEKLKNVSIASKANTPDVFLWESLLTNVDGSTTKLYCFRFGVYDTHQYGTGQLPANFYDKLAARPAWTDPNGGPPSAWPNERPYQQGCSTCPVAVRFVNMGTYTETQVYVTGAPP